MGPNGLGGGDAIRGMIVSGSDWTEMVAVGWPAG
jgi:hypothetical protein